MVGPEALGPVMSNPLWSQENVAEQTDYLMVTMEQDGKWKGKCSTILFQGMLPGDTTFLY